MYVYINEIGRKHRRLIDVPSYVHWSISELERVLNFPRYLLTNQMDSNIGT